MGENQFDLEPGMSRAAGRSAGAWFLLFLVRFYITFLSPFFGGSCKFYPSCSNYAFEAISTHGARRGFVLAVKRLLRCRPFTRGGFDPVPETELRQGAISNAENLAFTNNQAPTVGCIGSPFARAIRGRARRVSSEEEPAR